MPLQIIKEHLHEADEGIYLTLKPIFLDQELKGAQVVLVNFYDFPISLTYSNFLSRVKVHGGNDALDANEMMTLWEIETDDLNDNPELVITIAGMGEFRHLLWNEKLKLKASHLFDTFYFFCAIEQPATIFRFPYLKPASSGLQGIDAASIEKRLKEKMGAGIKKEMASRGFKDTIDLHADKLFVNHFKTMEPWEIFDEQVKAARKFLDDAMQHKLRRVIIIHGKGTGRLKQEILQFIHTLGPNVKAEPYLPYKYEGGALEVFFW